MIRWLWDRLFCWHNWEKFKDGYLLNDNGQKTGYYEIHRCSKCKQIRELRT